MRLPGWPYELTAADRLVYEWLCGTDMALFDGDPTRALGNFYGYPSCCIEAFIVDLDTWTPGTGHRRPRTLYRGTGHVLCDLCLADPDRADRVAETARRRRICPTDDREAP